MTLGRQVRARLLRRWRDLREMVTLRRREKRLSTYLLRLACLGLILVVLPLKKAVQLGVVGTLLAGLKVGAAVALVTAALAAVYAVEALARRRRLASA